MTYQSTLHALADPTRRTILEHLRKGPQPVGELAEGLPVTRPAVSQHLKVLKNAGLVKAHKSGTRRVYSIEIEGLAELRHYLETFWGDVLKSFQAQAVKSQGRKKDGER